MGLFTTLEEENTYSLNTAKYLEISQKLIETVGNISKVFKSTGYDLDWIQTTKNIMEYIEQQAILLVQTQPDITEEYWYQVLFQGLQVTDQLTEKQKAEFSDMTLEQFKTICNYIIWTNPTHDDTHSRTFNEFVESMQTTIESEI